jgi:hypothetical protein
MPRKTIDYTKTNFYKVVSKDLHIKQCYIGYTTDFRRRANEHSRKSEMPILSGPNAMLYDFVKNNGGWCNFEMILIETKTCNGSLDAQRIRRIFVEELKATLNGSNRLLADTRNEQSIQTEQPENPEQSNQRKQPEQHKQPEQSKQSKQNTQTEQHTQPELNKQSKQSKQPEQHTQPELSKQSKQPEHHKQNDKDPREGALWFEIITQAAGFNLITNEGEKDRARLKFLSLTKQLEDKDRRLNNELENHIKRGGSKREFIC